jgi:hypothetical protein
MFEDVLNQPVLYTLSRIALAARALCVRVTIRLRRVGRQDRFSSGLFKALICLKEEYQMKMKKEIVSVGRNPSPKARRQILKRGIKPENGAQRRNLDDSAEDYERKTQSTIAETVQTYGGYVLGTASRADDEKLIDNRESLDNRKAAEDEKQLQRSPFGIV